jgi:hypothetical protein
MDIIRWYSDIIQKLKDGKLNTPLYEKSTNY